MGTDCKSVGDAYAGSNPALPTSFWDEGVMEMMEMMKVI